MLCTLGFSVSAQVEDKELNAEDYKDPEQFDKFRKRRILVGSWQIHELRDEGALVVRLKTNKILIDELTKKGQTDLALEKQMEQFAINKNLMFAYRDNFKFCNLYFMLSTNSDTLLNGAREGIFLDTNLNVDPKIKMTEKFYLIAERDYAYNSSIGFVREDSARQVKEHGNPVKEMAIVIKNKYGHQLKQPFPYYVKEKNFMDAAYNFPIRQGFDMQGRPMIFFVINRTYLEKLKNHSDIPKYKTRRVGDVTYTNVKIKKQFTYEKLSQEVIELNDNLFQFYRSSSKPDLTTTPENIKIFFY